MEHHSIFIQLENYEHLRRYNEKKKQYVEPTKSYYSFLLFCTYVILFCMTIICTRHLSTVLLLLLFYQYHPPFCFTLRAIILLSNPFERYFLILSPLSFFFALALVQGYLPDFLTVSIFAYLSIKSILLRCCQW